MHFSEVGQSIPPNTPHAVSVSLPTWSATVGYEEGEEWVLSKMKTGYPRFYVHKVIAEFAQSLCEIHGLENEKVMLFPSYSVACRCVDFLHSQNSIVSRQRRRIFKLVPKDDMFSNEPTENVAPEMAGVFFPSHDASSAKAFWQHTGDGTSSRRAEFCYQAFQDGMVRIEFDEADALLKNKFCKGPRRYQKRAVTEQEQTKSVKRQLPLPEPSNNGTEGKEHQTFVEERFGRNLNLSFVKNAKIAIRRRIAGSLTADVDLTEAIQIPNNEQTARKVNGFSEDDVYLYPAGMSAIFNAHRMLMAARGPMKSVCFGFPYIDTLKILEKWGSGCLFYGDGESKDLDDLERRLESGERYLALFCEFPGNPLLKSPNLKRIQALGKKHGFAIVVDETIGNFLNVHVLPYSDIVVSSLTKVFSGDSNVMGGSLLLNNKGQYYNLMKDTMETEYEDNYWAEDVLFMERNSRDFVQRIDKININAEAICDLLRKHPRVKMVYYPKHSASRSNYDMCRNPNGGYGGLLSVTFYTTPEAVVFFDQLDIAKGPSLGTNFTLSSPYTLLAHYAELDWAAQFGVETDLVRISVGLEETSQLIQRFEHALHCIEKLSVQEQAI